MKGTVDVDGLMVVVVVTELVTTVRGIMSRLVSLSAESGYQVA
jgi:hypothetical protein